MLFTRPVPLFATAATLLLLVSAPRFAAAAPPYPTPAPSPSGAPSPGAAWSNGGSTTPLGGPQVAITYNDGLDANGNSYLPPVGTAPSSTGFQGYANTHYWGVTTDTSQSYSVTPNEACVKFTQYYLADPFRAEDGDAMIIMPLVDPIVYFDVTLVNRTDLASSLYPTQGAQYWTSYTLTLPDVPGVSFAADMLDNPTFFTGEGSVGGSDFSKITVSPDHQSVTFSAQPRTNNLVGLGAGDSLHLRYAILFPDPVPGQAAAAYNLNFRPNVSSVTPEPGLLAFASSGLATLGAGMWAGRKRRRAVSAPLD